MDDMVQKLQALSFLTPEITRDKIIDALDGGLGLSLRMQLDYEKIYQEKLEFARLGAASLQAEAAALAAGLVVPGESGEDFADARLRQEQEAKADLETQEATCAENLKELARHLKSNHLLVRRMREVAGGRTHAAVNFTSELAKLNRLTYTVLKQSVDEEKHVKETLEHMQRQEEIENDELAQMGFDFSLAQEERTRVCEAKSAQIRDLEAQLEALSLRAQSDRETLAHKVEDEVSREETDFANKDKQLNTDLKELQRQLDVRSGDHLLAELQRQRQKDLRDSEIGQKVKVYDATMQEKQAKLEKLLLVYEKESRELRRLNGYFATRETERAREEEEMRRVIEARNKEIHVERLRSENEVFMDAIVGGFEERQEKAAKLAAKAAKAKKDAKNKK